MTQVAILGYKAKLLTSFDSQAPNLDDALAIAELKRGEVDFGTIAPNFNIIVYEYGLMEGPPNAYYRLGKQLFNGNAVLFKTDLEGNTIDFPDVVIKHMNDGCPDVEFFNNIDEVEAAITARRLIRPATRINNEPPVWEWNR